MSAFADVSVVEVDPVSVRIYEHGWQTGSPSTVYTRSDRPFRPTSDARRVMCYRPDAVAPGDAFQGEGLLAVLVSASGPVHVFGARDGLLAVPSIRADVDDGGVVVRADGEVESLVVDTADGFG
jgi:alpha-galactosidase